MDRGRLAIMLHIREYENEPDESSLFVAATSFEGHSGGTGLFLPRRSYWIETARCECGDITRRNPTQTRYGQRDRCGSHLASARKAAVARTFRKRCIERN